MRSLTLHRIIVMCICSRFIIVIIIFDRGEARRGEEERRWRGVAKSLIFAHYMRTVCFHNNNANIWFRKRFLHHLFYRNDLPNVHTFNRLWHQRWWCKRAARVEIASMYLQTNIQSSIVRSFVQSGRIAQFASLLCEINLNWASVFDTETNTFDECGT